MAVMTSRSAVAFVMAGLGLVVVVLAVRDRLRTAERVAVVTFGVALVALVLNEAVRDGGLLA